jgi:hypothetical protein
MLVSTDKDRPTAEQLWLDIIKPIPKSNLDSSRTYQEKWYYNPHINSSVAIYLSHFRCRCWNSMFSKAILQNVLKATRAWLVFSFLRIRHSCIILRQISMLQIMVPFYKRFCMSVTWKYMLLLWELHGLIYYRRCLSYAYFGNLYSRLAYRILHVFLMITWYRFFSLSRGLDSTTKVPTPKRAFHWWLSEIFKWSCSFFSEGVLKSVARRC